MKIQLPGESLIEVSTIPIGGVFILKDSSTSDNLLFIVAKRDVEDNSIHCFDLQNLKTYIISGGSLARYFPNATLVLQL
jgi:hypothetical protein